MTGSMRGLLGEYQAKHPTLGWMYSEGYWGKTHHHHEAHPDTHFLYTHYKQVGYLHNASISSLGLELGESSADALIM
jgi:hypothetical protein